MTAELSLTIDAKTGVLLVEAPDCLPREIRDALEGLAGKAKTIACAAPTQAQTPAAASDDELARLDCVRVSGYWHGSVIEGPGRRHETLCFSPSPGSDAADACGCTTRTPSAGDAVAADHPIPPASMPEASAEPAAPRRSLKLVVTLTPAEAGQYRAALALGADGCDPVLRSAMVSALPEALEQVPNLLDDAETHWRLHPRNPTTVRAARHSATDQSRPGSTATQAQAAAPGPRGPPDAKAEEESPPSRPATNPVAVPTRPTGGQLTLFG